MTESSPRIVSQGPRILIVDDERRNRQLLEVMLASEGYRVEMANVGSEALDLIRHNPPDLIMLDVMMPGLDGYQVVARIKADPASKHIPVIMLSALDDQNSRKHGLTAGAEAFLSKPVNREEMFAVVRSLLGPAT
jgi:two-component system cell cycle response regulator